MRKTLFALVLFGALSLARAAESLGGFMFVGSAIFFAPSHPYYVHFPGGNPAPPESALTFRTRIGSIGGISVSFLPYTGDLLYGRALDGSRWEGPFLDKREVCEEFPYVGSFQTHIVDIGLESPRRHPLSFVAGGGPSLLFAEEATVLGFYGEECSDELIDELSDYAGDHGSGEIFIGANAYCYASYEFAFLVILGGAKLRWFNLDSISGLHISDLLRGTELFAGIGLALAP